MIQFKMKGTKECRKYLNDVKSKLDGIVKQEEIIKLNMEETKC